MNRRQFLSTAAGAAAALALPLPLRAASAQRLVILHTNDTHSRIDPFPMDGGRFQGMGGVARRSALISAIRKQNPNVLLVDSGDIFQGTPYFNFFGGEIEFRTMSEMGYEVATLGNHDFDNGVEGFVKVLPHARFEFVNANYDVSKSALAEHVRPYTIRQYGPLKVGLFGLGIDFAGLVLDRLHEGVTYRDPLPIAKEMVQTLRGQGCNLIVCLSHLGYRYKSEQVSDTVLAQQVPGIDLILGGHTHTFLDRPDVHSHLDGRATVVHQVGWAGIRLGRIDVSFDREGQVQGWMSQHYDVQQGVADDLA